MERSITETRDPTRLARCCCIVAAALIAGCATSPPRQVQTISLGAQDHGQVAGYPPPGTIWRLEAREFEALGPIVPAADPPPALPRKSLADSDAGVLLVPSIIDYGVHFGFGWSSAPYWPYYRHTPILPHHYHRRPYRWRR